MNYNVIHETKTSIDLQIIIFVIFHIVSEYYFIKIAVQYQEIHRYLNGNSSLRNIT